MTQTTSRRRKVLAILAAGAVVGVGGAYTLAAWNDSEFLTAGFASGSFNLQGSADGATFADHDTSPGEEVDAEHFTLDTTNMLPAQTVYGSFFVRLDENTTVDGQLAQADVQASGEPTDYGYTVAALGAGSDCDDAGIAAGTIIGQADALNAPNEVSTQIDLAHGEGAAVGTAVQLCIAVTSVDGEEFTQGASTTVTWEFEATSVDVS